MSIHAILEHILSSYAKECANPFSGNLLGKFIRREAPNLFDSIVNDKNRYKIVGSCGQGNWAKVPWISIFDRLVTRSAQEGYYIVYLFQTDLSGVYISLNQGVESIRRTYGAGAKNSLKIRSADFAARLGDGIKLLDRGAINLKIETSSDLGSYYEAGSICSKYYPKESLPQDEELNNDLSKFIELYALLSLKELQTSSEKEEDELGYEDLTKIRIHKRIERNQQLAIKAKRIHGYTCKACGFDFSKVFPVIGKNFIEAHHLTPFSQLKGEKVPLNPKTDFTVLCANCHRMIHKTNDPSDISKFAATYFRKEHGQP